MQRLHYIGKDNVHNIITYSRINLFYDIIFPGRYLLMLLYMQMC
ncbi:MAG: hypothetical protein ACI8RD_012112, partial [Bacillariaceae sp.]